MASSLFLVKSCYSMLRFGSYLLQFHLASDWSETINIPEIFTGIHGFIGKTVTLFKVSRLNTDKSFYSTTCLQKPCN